MQFFLIIIWLALYLYMTCHKICNFNLFKAKFPLEAFFLNQNLYVKSAFPAMKLIKTSMSSDLSLEHVHWSARQIKLEVHFQKLVSRKNLALKRQRFWNLPCNCLMRQFPIVPAAAVYVHNQLFCFWRSNALIHCHNGVKVFMKSY